MSRSGWPFPAKKLGILRVTQYKGWDYTQWFYGTLPTQPGVYQVEWDREGDSSYAKWAPLSRDSAGEGWFAGTKPEDPLGASFQTPEEAAKTQTSLAVYTPIRWRGLKKCR